MSLTAEQIAQRQARRAAREAKKAAQEQRRAVNGEVPREELLARRDARQAARRAPTTADMHGWVTPAGAALPTDADGRTLALTRGTVATQDPAINGVVNPKVKFLPGSVPNAVVAATANGPRCYVGLQWINADGTVNPAVLWAPGPGRVLVQGAPPPTAAGVRGLLACYSTAAGDLAGRDTATRVLQQNLRVWITANRPGDL